MFDFLSDKFSSVFSRLTGKGTLSEKNIQDALTSVTDSLIEADVPYDLACDFVDSIKGEVLGQKVLSSVKPGEQFVKIVHGKLKKFLGGNQESFYSFQIPSVMMVMGLQGSGKTTSLAKIASFLRKKGAKKGKKRRILLASVDFYRPAAVDQLKLLAQKGGFSFFQSTETDPIKAAIQIHDYYKKECFDFLLLDTAGRLHVDSEMLQELQAIDMQLEPRYKLLVLDAMTGQESLNVAKAFNQSVGIYGAVLTKMDSDSRGGTGFSFCYSLKKPILFLGNGETIDDLEMFRPERMADRILGMGDVVTLVEKAEEKIAKEDQETLYKRMMKGQTTLEDFAKQMEMMSKIGSLGQIMKYMPGLGGKQISSEMLEKGEVEMKRFKAIINSMTPKERCVPAILNAARKKRVALGAGVTLGDVNVLLKRFEESKQYAKLLKRFQRF